ncbi:MAG: hypothetical protein K9N01_10200 [Cephaloticoccus sp.]|nr:hypothetical protein [Cephaloticoccus sp.]
MKTNSIKNFLYTIAALGLGFFVLTHLPISSTQLFGAMIMAGIGLITVKDYTPRRQMRFEPSAAKQVVTRTAPDHVSPLPAALFAA